MYYEIPKDGLSFGNLVELVKNVEKDNSYYAETLFPYTLEVCRCRYCAYCHEGKCALKRCCCMGERVRAKSCTFTEILEDVFDVIKENVFHFRLRIAEERAAELKTCFLNSEPLHRKRFYEGCALTRKYENGFIAQLFLLSASERLWRSAKQVLYAGWIDYGNMDTRCFEGNDYLYFCAAMDLQYGTSHTDLQDLSNDEVVDFDAFRMVCHALAICAYGVNVIKVSEKARKKKREGRKYDRADRTE